MPLTRGRARVKWVSQGGRRGLEHAPLIWELHELRSTYSATRSHRDRHALVGSLERVTEDHLHWGLQRGAGESIGPGQSLSWQTSKEV
jgi:hypothetical protein